MRLLTPLGLWTLAGLSGCGKEEPPSPPVAVKKPPAPKASPAAPAAEPARKAPPDLMDPDPAIRQKAALSLGERSADAANVVPQLVERLHDPQEEVRLAAIDSLARLAPASVPALIDLLGHPKSELRQRAARALGKAGTPAAPAVPNLIAALPDADLRLSPEIVAALAGIGKLSVEPLAQSLASAPPRGRRGAAEALGLIGADAAPALPALRDRLKDPDTHVQQAARAAGRRIRARTRPLAEMIAELKHEDGNARAEAAEELATLGPAAKEALPALLDGLKDLTDRRQPVSSLQQAIGAQGWPAHPPLLALLQKGTRPLWARVAPPLQRISRTAPSESVPVLVATLRGPHAGEKWGALQVLKEMGRAAPGAVPAVIPFLKDPDPEIRRSAAGYFQSVGPDGAEAVPALIEALKDRQTDVRSLAVQALGAVGPKAASAREALQEAAKGADPSLAYFIRQALEKIGPGK